MFSNPELLLHLALTGLLVLAGLQDWKKREIGDLITIPLFFLGITFTVLRIGNLDLLPVVVAAILAAAWIWKQMGGADVKILIGLWGLWPAAGFVGMLAAAIWGLTLILTRKRKLNFPGVTAISIPGVTAIAIGTGLTILLEAINILSN